MAEVRLRAAADADLATILDFSIRTFGRATAEEYLLSFEKPFELLVRHPEAGAIDTRIQLPVRCLSHRSHRIFYDIEGDTVWIVRVLHHAMDAGRWLG